MAWAPVTFLDREGHRTHKLLRCIDRNIVIGKLRPEDHAPEGEVFTPGATGAGLCEIPQLLTRAADLLASCETAMTSTFRHNRQTFTGSTRDDLQLLHKLTRTGLVRRYGKGHAAATDRVERELKGDRDAALCAILPDYLGYYPLCFKYWFTSCGAWFWRQFDRGLLPGDHGCRPLELDLYFERFINPTVPRRLTLTSTSPGMAGRCHRLYLQAVRAGVYRLLATYNTFKGKSIVRELGKVFGLPKADIDAIVDEPLAREKHHPYAKHIFHLASGWRMSQLPVHPFRGILITERPLYEHTALADDAQGLSGHVHFRHVPCRGPGISQV